MADIKISFVVAVAENGVIGRDGDLPWKLSTDLKRFKALTIGKPLIMGRKTFESIGSRPLPGRPHIIITRSPDFRAEGVEVAASLEAAIARGKELARELGVDEVVVGGGGEIFKLAMPLVEIMHVTHVESDMEGDAYFPTIDPEVFVKTEENHFPAGEKDSHATRYAVYHRKVTG